MVKLKTIITGHRFRWAGVLFEATHETEIRDRRKQRKVVYCERAGQGVFQPGDRDWFPLNTPVEPAPFAEGVV